MPGLQRNTTVSQALWLRTFILYASLRVAEHMKAVRIHQFGGPEVLTYEEVPDPRPRKDQVLVRVRACAMNHLDLFVRKGLPGVNLPHILGSDIAGEIVEVGEYVTRFKSGQRVL